MEWNDILLVAAALAAILMCVLLIVLLMRQKALEGRLDREDVRDELLRIREKIDTGAHSREHADAVLRQEVSLNLQRMSQYQQAQLNDMAERQAETFRNIRDDNNIFRDKLVEAVALSMEKLQNANEKRLTAIQGVVDEQLGRHLNERLETSFAGVTQQLNSLYRSLGELKELSGGVSELNRTLANVKTRGNWGEVQLRRILEETMAPGQFVSNVVTKRGSRDRVEFAVRFPASVDGGEDVLMPIDAKFPADIYNRVIDAADRGDSEALTEAQNDLKNRIKKEASDIAGKYLDPPRTTNFAFLYLPTEGLYAEVLRLDGLTEACQKKGVIVTGPTTVTAVLNSLRVGFRNVALSKKSVEVLKLLEAVKGQIGHLDDVVARTQKKLEEAVGLTEDIQKRTRRLNSRMKTVGEMDQAASDALLDLGNDNDLLMQEEDN